MLENAYLVFTCKDRCRYSRKRATFCRHFADRPIDLISRGSRRLRGACRGLRSVAISDSPHREVGGIFSVSTRLPRQFPYVQNNFKIFFLFLFLFIFFFFFSGAADEGLPFFLPLPLFSLFFRADALRTS